MLVVESLDPGEVMGRVAHNHVVLWSKVKLYVGG